MKKLFKTITKLVIIKKVVLLIFLFSTNLFGQLSFPTEYEDVTDSQYKSTNGKYIIIKPSIVIEKEGTAAELHKLAVSWVNETYKSAEDVIKGNNEGEYLKINGFEPGLFQINVLGMPNFYDARYTIEMRFRDGRFKFDLLELEQYIPPSDYSSGGWFEYKLSFQIENRKGKPKKEKIANYKRVQNYFTNLLTSIQKYQGETTKAKEADDW